MADSLSQHCPNCEAQAAEIEKLRELLNRVADEADHDCETMWITDIIRAALGETK